MNMKKYKIVKAEFDPNFEKAEAVMNEMSEKGWEVVSVSSDSPRTLKLLITFCRDEC